MYKYLIALIVFTCITLSCCDTVPCDIKANPVAPSQAQLNWQKMELIGFVHFTVNTFTDKEWGDGTESPAIFNPEQLDARQWVSAAQAAGMKMLILTAKHHDGFCLWPSAFTEHSVKNSPWKKGKGDVVKELSDACHEAGLKFGIYLSPWDRHDTSYGTAAYNEHYMNQLRELLTNYGTISELWMDGAKGDNARDMEYDFTAWRKLIYELQPHCLIFSDAGPDIRWVGNENGIAGETNWSTLTPEGIIIGKANTSLLNTGDPMGTNWVPAECDVSIRPGWFYHSGQDSLVKSPEKLVDLYYQSVGRNGVLLLNIPPDRRGLINEGDVSSLRKFRSILDETFSVNLAFHAKGKGKSLNRSCFSPDMLFDGSDSSYWVQAEGKFPLTLEVDLDSLTQFNRILIMEPIRFGQSISSFAVDAMEKGGWKEIAAGTTIGYKRILKLPMQKSSKLRIRILEAKTRAALAEFALYKASTRELD
jgi:alpha-L-fucosidase